MYLSLQIDTKNHCHVFPSSMKREMRKFFDVVVQWGPERNVKKSVFCRRRCLSSLLSTYGRNISTDLVCVPMDLLPWAPVPLGFPAVLGLWEGGTGARGVEVFLGDLPDDEPVLEGLDWYWKKKRGYLNNRSRTSSVARPLKWTAESRLLDLRGRTSPLGLKIIAKWRYCICPAND